jgi:hypothetical protein
MSLLLYLMPQDYILVPHFYRLNWAREMSEFLKNCGHFQYLSKNFQYGNYSKAGKLRDEYLNSLLDNGSELKGGSLFFVNLNDYIYFNRRRELKEKFKIAGFMRGSRYFEGEPGNASIGKDSLVDMQNLEGEALKEVDQLFLGSKAFCSFLNSKITDLDIGKINILGIPIFIPPYYLGKTHEEVKRFQIQKSKDLIIWNHRLQKQKNPWVLFALDQFVKERIAVCTPEALSAAYSVEMKHHELTFNKIVRDNGKKREAYLDCLKKSSFVLSFAEHETWGNSMIEAIMQGAAPIAPDGELCAYKDLYPKEFLYPAAWIKKEKNIDKRKDNMKKLSAHIDNFMKCDHSLLLNDLQDDLWSEYNKDQWLKNLTSLLN